MNKIIIEKNKFIDSQEVIDNNLIIDKDIDLFLENFSSNTLNIKVLEGVNAKINIFNKDSKVDFDIFLMNNSKLSVNFFSINSSSKVNISLKENSNFKYNHSLITEKMSINEINIVHDSPNSSSEIINHGFNYGEEKLLFKVDGFIGKNAIKTLATQDNKIINYKNGNSEILPNLFVDNKEVVANHSAYIGRFKEEILFYMKSRGINEKLCYNLLLKGFLIGNMDLDYLIRDKFLKIINEWDENHE